MCQIEILQNIGSNLNHRYIGIVYLTAINLVVVLVEQSVVIAIVAGLDSKDSVPAYFPGGFLTHDLRLCHIACAIALHDFCELADVEHIRADLGVILVDKLTRLYDGLIGIMNLDAATVRNTEQVLIVAVDKSDVLAIQVKLIRHLRFPPLSNSILKLVLPSSETSIYTVASKVLPVFFDLQPFSFTLPEASSFCAVALVMLLPILSK